MNKLAKALLEHYSPKKDLTEIDPSHKGSGVDRTRDVSEHPISYFYHAGTQPESVVADRAAHKYTVQLPEHAKIYDIGTDPDKHVNSLFEASKNRQVNAGIVTNDEIHDKLKQHKYHGFTNSLHPDLPNVVGLYEKQPVHEWDEATKGKKLPEHVKKSESNVISPNEVENHIRSIHPRKEDFNEGDLIDRIHSVPNYEFHEKYPIKNIDHEEFPTDADYVERLKTNKQFHPIVLHSYGNMGNSIIDGSHRIRAAKELGMTHLPAYVGINKPFGKSELKKGLNGDWQKEGYTTHIIDRHAMQGEDVHEANHPEIDFSQFGRKHDIPLVAISKDPTGKMVGSASFDNNNVAVNTQIHPEHQRKGLASKMYNDVEKYAGPIIGGTQSPSAKKLWAQPNRPFGKSLQKSIPSGWQHNPKSKLPGAHFSHPTHGTVSILKHPKGHFEVKHNAGQAGLTGQKGPFKSAEEAGTHARNFMTAMNEGKTAGNTVKNLPSANSIVMGKSLYKSLLKSIAKK